MVSPTTKQHFQVAYDKVRNQSINIDDYGGKDADIIFEIITAETFIAGIASKLIDAMPVSLEEKLILERVFLDGTEWRLEDGSYCSITHLPKVLNYARQIEALKKLCL